MEARIGVISPYPEFTALAHEVTKELGEEVLIEEGILGKGAAIARGWEKDARVEVIVGRGPTAAVIKKTSELPVIKIDISSYDVLDALYRAKKLGGRIGFIDYKPRKDEHDLGYLAEMLGVSFETFFYENEFALTRQLEKAVQSGVDVLVGTGVCVVRLAERRGIHGVLVRSSREAIREALRRARETIEVSDKERARTQALQAILDLAYDGIIVVDGTGRVIVFNPVAETTLGIKAKAIIGRNISEFTAVPALDRVYQDGQARIGELQQIGPIQLVVNRVPIRIKDEHHGTAVTFQPVSTIQTLEEKIRKELYAKGLVARFSFDDIVGTSRVLRSVVEKAKTFAQSECTILITGESGTGKELFAHSIHRHSARKNRPFVVVNCAALPENLLESELFGYEDGAFTGAKKGGKPGLFELAQGGTIFLDEIGEMPVSLQARLLRALQGKEVMRVGGNRVIPVDVRVIAATNRHLARDVRDGRFREDLYFRLNVLNLEIPALRSRTEDIASLARHFLRAEAGQPGAPEVPSRMDEILNRYDWPGNVRELENFIRRYMILCEGERDKNLLLEKLLSEVIRSKQLGSPGPAKTEVDSTDRVVVQVGPLEFMEQQIITKLDSIIGGDKSNLARLLGISRTTLWKKLKVAELSGTCPGTPVPRERFVRGIPKAAGRGFRN